MDSAGAGHTDPMTTLTSIHRTRLYEAVWEKASGKPAGHLPGRMKVSSAETGRAS